MNAILLYHSNLPERNSNYSERQRRVIRVSFDAIYDENWNWDITEVLNKNIDFLREKIDDIGKSN